MGLNGRINLERISILLLDSNHQGMDILSQIFGGFGARNLYRCTKVSDAADFIKNGEIDLIICSDVLDVDDGYDFVRWLRRLEGNPNIYAPVIMVSGHTKRSVVGKARDCGANFLLAKPISPQVVLERVMWVAREKRPFLETDDYTGPDRRHHEATAAENKGRRKGDREALAKAQAAAETQTPDLEAPSSASQAEGVDA